MIADKIKNIINKSDICNLLELDDNNDEIRANYFKIKLNNDHNGVVEFYLFGSIFTGMAFFNGLDSCYIETNTNKNITINLKDISYCQMSCDLRILDFFHIRSINVNTKTSIH